MKMIRNKALLLALGFSSLVFIQSAQAGPIERGRELHKENCISCHVSIQGGDGTGIYTREDRKVEDYDALDAQVRRCKTSLNASWPEHQIQDLLSYLNGIFYKFQIDDNND